ncbi:MAG: DUF1853 family protein [Pseudomonadota bacterium]
MASQTDQAPANFQARFERKWAHLTLPHVRALAWLLDAPDLLDPASPLWGGHIAALGPATPALADWLAALQRDPAALDAALGPRFYSRLGLYAEKLMAFYFAQHGALVAHGLQVRASRNDTVGEFDFLLRRGGQLLHLEFATKFYLLEAGGDRLHGLIGPNLADTLGAKMNKILTRQLALAAHPAARDLLPGVVDSAQALVKGWLFHPLAGAGTALDGIAPDHNRGFWCMLAQLTDGDGGQADAQFVLMPRLQWLAPLKVAAGVCVLSRGALADLLTRQFDGAPVLVARVRQADGWVIEQERGFIVPDDWRQQAAERRRDGRLPS